jgi:hypothetical protein
LFVTDKSPGLANNVEITVELSDIRPWYSRLRSLPPDDRRDLGAVVQNDLKNGVIEPSFSDRSCEALLLRKRGRHKVATNFQPFNNQSVTFPYPLALLTDCLDCLSRAKFMSAIDINGAYMSIPIPERFRKYFAFTCHLGLYQWTRLPYGWKNSGSWFYLCMATTFIGLIYVILCVYSDDTMIFGGTNEDEHMACIYITFLRCFMAGLHLDIVKCQLFATKLEYLGFEGSKEGIKPLARNVDKLLKIEIKKVRDIRSFIGLANFYRRFIPNFAFVVKPLNAFLQKNAKLPNPLPADVQIALDSVRKSLSSYPILVNPDMLKRFFLCTDGSRLGLGAMLCQTVDNVLCVCAYASSSICETQMCYSSPMLEALASVWGMLHFKHYLRAEFTLVTDQVVLRWLRCKKGGLGSMTKYVMESQAFQFTVQHVPGRIFHGPDLLSRAGARVAIICDIVKELDVTEYSYASAQVEEIAQTNDEKLEWTTLSPSDVPSELCRADWIDAQTKCEVLQTLVTTKAGFEKRQDLWYAVHELQQPRVVVPLSLRAPVLMLIHGLLGHRGAKPIEKWMLRVLYWIAAPLQGESGDVAMRDYLRRWIRACVDCNRRKMNPIKQPSLTPAFLNRFHRPMKKIAIDWCGKIFPKSNEGYEHLFTAICDFSSFPIPICLKTRDPNELGEALFANIFAIFGFPETIHSDNDVRLATAMEYVFKRFGIRSTKILPRHPEMNGPVERWHRYLNASLCILLPRYSDWPQIVHITAFAYRALVQETSGFSPHFLLCGRDMILPLEASLGLEEERDLFEGKAVKPPDESVMTDAEVTESRRQRVFDYADITAQRLQAAFKLVRRSRFNATLKRQEKARKDFTIIFKVGDPVYLKERNAANMHGTMRTSQYLGTVQGTPSKLMFLWTGPHVISSVSRNPSKYGVWHSTDRKECFAHVSDLRKHVAFSNSLFSTSTPTLCEPYSPAPEGFTPWSTDDGVAAPVPGDVCVARCREFGLEDICVVQMLENGRFQWFSNPLNNPTVTKDVRGRTSFDNFRRTCFLPGWEIRESPTDVRYCDAADILAIEGEKVPFITDRAIVPCIFLWGVQLTKNGTFKVKTLAWIEQECKRQDEMQSVSAAGR